MGCVVVQNFRAPLQFSLVTKESASLLNGVDFLISGHYSFSKFLRSHAFLLSSFLVFLYSSFDFSRYFRLPQCFPFCLILLSAWVAITLRRVRASRRIGGGTSRPRRRVQPSATSREHVPVIVILSLLLLGV